MKYTHILGHSLNRLFVFVIISALLFSFSAPRLAGALDCPPDWPSPDCSGIKTDGGTSWIPTLGLCGGGDINFANSSNLSDNLKNVYNYFLTKSLSKIQAAAIVGNIAVESGGNPVASQNPRQNISDPMQVPTSAQAASAAANNTPYGVGRAWGLIQWDHAARAIYYQRKAAANGNIADIKTQLDIVWWHMNNESPTGKSNMMSGFTQTDLSEAVRYYENTMEGAGIPNYAARENAAKIAFNTYPATGASTGTFTQASNGCQCGEATAPTVVLDPGHSGVDKQGMEKDSETGLYIGDSSNPGERAQAWGVAQTVKKTLEDKGYRVLLTKENEDDYVNLKQRAQIANDANAAIAVSIHTDTGSFGDTEKSWVTAQKVGGYRENDLGLKKEFTDEAVAQKSQQYATAMVETRKAAGEKGAVEHDLSFNDRPGLSAGNLSMVQLFSTVPWVYNEAGQSGFDANVYAKGIADGIVKAVPASSETSNVNSGCAGAAAGNVTQTAINYAWPEYKGRGYTTMKASYVTAVSKAKTAGKYVGGDACGAVDCGAFTTRVIQDSGVDPNYGGGGYTVVQQAYMDKHPEMYQRITPKSSADLKSYPFAIAINVSHTYLYIGTDHPGFGSDIASASFCERAPMAGKEAVADPNYAWYVFKQPKGEEI